MKVVLDSKDALIIVDMQNDFMPGGRLVVPGGDEIIPLLNRYIDFFHTNNLLVVATRDWHPSNHCSFQLHGGLWPPHCIAESDGAAFHPSLELPHDTHIISKATTPEKDAYSGFDNTQLNSLLHSFDIHRVFIGGIATEYCVLNTVKDALQFHYITFLLFDAISAINQQSDGLETVQEMITLGATPIYFEALVI